MVIYTDPETGEYLWACPECGKFIRFHSLLAVQMAKRAGGCQGCRARMIMTQKPVLINAFMAFWTRTNAWPQSPFQLRHSSAVKPPDQGYCLAGQPPRSASVVVRDG